MKLDNQTIMMVVVAIVLGMLVANMFKEVCGCKVVEGQQALVDGCITPPVTATTSTPSGNPSSNWVQSPTTTADLQCSAPSDTVILYQKNGENTKSLICDGTIASVHSLDGAPTTLIDCRSPDLQPTYQPVCGYCCNG